MTSRFCVSLALAATLGLVTFGAAGAAAADAPLVGIGVARTSDYEHGTFVVPAWTDAPGATLSGVTATVSNASGPVDTVPLTLDAADLWEPAAPLQLQTPGQPGLPALGHYTLGVTAVDDQGNTTTRPDAGTLDFTLAPVFQPAADGQSSLSFTPAALTLHQQSTAASGRLMGRLPGTRALEPLPDRAVSITTLIGDDRHVGSVETVTSDDHGDFTGSVQPDADQALYTVSTTLDDDTASGSASGYGSPGISQTSAVITAHANRTQLSPGAKLTITGTVRTGQSSTSPVVGGAPLQIGLTSDVEHAIAVTTRPDGTFTATLVAVSGDYVAWFVQPAGPFVAGESVQNQVNVPHEASFGATRISQASSGLVSATTTLDATYRESDTASYPQTVRLQYSADGRTSWHTLASAVTGNVPGLGDDAGKVSAYGYVSGYYRLTHPLSNYLDTASSAPVHLGRTLTRVAGNNAGPEPVRTGSYVTTTGTLQQYVRHSWQNMAHTTIYLYFLPSGAKTSRLLATGRTDARGHASLRARATGSGAWQLYYFGDATHFNSTSTPDAVRAR